jgi:hypothetical protein
MTSSTDCICDPYDRERGVHRPSCPVDPWVEPKPDIKSGDRITYWDQGTRRRAIVRGFEEGRVIVDIDPPLKGAAGASLGRRIERRNIVKRI